MTDHPDDPTSEHAPPEWPPPTTWPPTPGSDPWAAWGAPPPAPPARSDAARRALAAVAVIALVLVSGGVGAAISAAVHGGSQSLPFSTSQQTFDNNGGRLDAKTRAIAEKVSPALVGIYSTIPTSTGPGQAAGTGMILTSSGEVLTNNHVIADATAIRVELVKNGDVHTARVVGYDVADDVALLKIDNVSGLPTVDIGNASRIAAGDSVVAIGNAGGRGGTPTVTAGAITALDQQVTAGDRGSDTSETLRGMIQIDARIEAGDSGGPLLDAKGRVIGMNTAAAAGNRFFEQSGRSTAFAIPIDGALRLIHQIEHGNESGNVHIGVRGLLGIQVQDAGGRGGALVVGVQSGSPADSAGMSSDDVIVALGGKTITGAQDLTATMSPYHPNDRVEVGWVDQSGARHHASLRLIKGPPA